MAAPSNARSLPTAQPWPSRTYTYINHKRFQKTRLLKPGTLKQRNTANSLYRSTSTLYDRWSATSDPAFLVQCYRTGVLKTLTSTYANSKKPTKHRKKQKSIRLRTLSYLGQDVKDCRRSSVSVFICNTLKFYLIGTTVTFRSNKAATLKPTRQH